MVVVGLIEYKTPEMTSDAILSAHMSADFQHEIVLVVNEYKEKHGIREDALDLLADMIPNKENVGFTKAANQILRWNESKDVVLLNTDTLCEYGWLRELNKAAYAFHDKRVGMAAPRIDNKIIYKGHGVRKCGVGASGCDGTPSPFFGCFKGWFGFACAYFRRDLLNDQGYLNEKHVNYQSDKQYCFKICDAGYWIAHTHASVVHHIGLGSQRRKKVKFDPTLRRLLLGESV